MLHSRLFLHVLPFLISFFCVASDNDALVWTFAKVKAQGSLLGKDRFLPYYRMAPGELFDEAKHQQSLEKIRAELKNEGYLCAQIIDTINYNKKSKTVSVELRLQEGARFTIERVVVQIVDKIPQAATIQKELEKLLEGALLRHYVEKHLLDAEAHTIKSWLLRQGFGQPRIALSMTHDRVNKATLTFSVTLGARKQLLFEGNTFFTSEELTQSAVPEDGMLLPGALVAEDIETLYKRKGFFDVDVSAREKGDQLKIHIHEGVRASPWMKGVSFAFKEGKPSDKSAIEVLEKMASLISALSYYEADVMERRIKKARQKLHALGYWDAAITYAQPEGVVPFSLVVNLGQQRKAQSLMIPGYEALEKERIFSSWKHPAELRAVAPEVIETQRRWLEAHFKQKGFLFATASEEFRKTEHGMTLIWNIDTKGGPVRFGPTTVVGLQRMKPYTVIRELAYSIGDVWDREKIELTARRLKCLNMFESVSIGPDMGSAVPGMPVTEQPIRITCIEDDPYEIRTRLGFQFVSRSFTHLSWTTFKIGGSFVWKNPAGIADKLSLDADLTRYSRNFAAAYEVPWVGPLPIRTQVRLYSDRFDQPLFGSSGRRRLYKEEHDGASVTFNHSHPWWESNLKMGFELNKLFCISRELARVIDFEPALVDRIIPYFYWEPVVTFERIDNKADPCKGILTTLSAKAMVPPGVTDGWFIRACIEQSLFYPLFHQSVIGALRWRFGHIFNAKFSTILPTERFYLGGASSLRGYETNMVPPLNDVICDKDRVWVPVGGKSMGNINAEIRFPIYRWIRGVVFTDVGVLTQDKFADIAANEWLGASGVGLRVATPIGPIRFDIGWKWKKREPRDRRYAWFLTFGHAF